jgi:hypothetical protein
MKLSLTPMLVLAADSEGGPTAFKAARPVDTGDSQQIEPELFIQAGLFHACVHACPAEVGVHDEIGAEDVGCRAVKL